MLEGLNSAAAGMAAQQQRLDSVANDLANANTTGYKHGRVGFRDLIYEQAGRPAAQGVRTGHGAAAVDGGKSFGQGALQRTDRSLAVAIKGAGFLRPLRGWRQRVGSCSASIRAFQSRLEACQPSSLWPRRQ